MIELIPDCLILDINFQNKGTLWTPLHAAAFQEHGPVRAFLICYFLDVGFS